MSASRRALRLGWTRARAWARTWPLAAPSPFLYHFPAMHPLVWGLIIGWATAFVVAAVVGIVEHRRILALRERAKHAERLAELGTLTGGLAHEIKNPLSTIQLNLQLLMEDFRDSADPEDPTARRLLNRLQTCERETGRLRDILDDFMRYAGKIELERRPVELNRLCDDLVDFFFPQAQLQKVHLRLKRHPEPVTVSADERLLKQAVLNLVLNGMQAMPNGGEMILSVGKDEAATKAGIGAHACIDVIDTGTGIAPDALPRIFDAYYSTKKGGTGLGLAMTKRIAKEHGGDVTVTSEPGKGSDFSLRLPLT